MPLLHQAAAQLAQQYRLNFLLLAVSRLISRFERDDDPLNCADQKREPKPP